jgi:hypothetical protein
VLLQHSWQVPAQQTLPPLQLVPFVAVVQTPTEPLTLQAWQVSSQTELQQTLLTQKPEAHSPPSVQVSPF